ncbi:MAG: hypothetical protein FJY97_10985 [candidate division Zixibacteria bacterium]|nr:hypothetical protein [candidate division Zixibacteria bacterium]
MKRFIYPLFAMLLVLAARIDVLPAHAQTPDPQEIVDACLRAHGGERFTTSVVDFDFRGRHFTVSHRGGLFAYTRTYTDSTGMVAETLHNDGCFRELNGTRIELADNTRRAVASVINSVVYFALLPHKLNDPAVRKRYLGESIIAVEPYRKVEVTFVEEGGGEDHRDVFIYWIHKQRNTMDYLAYTYHVNGGGTRFREAFNTRVVEGIRVADYHNYRASSEEIPLEAYEGLFQSGKLIKVSDVNMENVRVRLTEMPQHGKGE